MSTFLPTLPSNFMCRSTSPRQQDLSLHDGVERAEIPKLSASRKIDRIDPLRVQKRRPWKLIADTLELVRYVVRVSPRHFGPRCDCNRFRREREIRDVHIIGAGCSCGSACNGNGTVRSC